MTKFAILIDAGFAKTKLGTKEKPATTGDFQNLVDKIQAHKFFTDKPCIASISTMRHRLRRGKTAL